MKYKPASGKFGESLTLHHSNAALQLQRVHPKGQDHRHTLNVEIARAVSFEPNWADKLVIQVSLTELPEITAVLLGLLPGTQNKYHGENRNKGYEVTNTKDDRTWAIFEPGTKKFFNFTPEEAFWLADFALGALAANTHGRTLSDVMNLLKITYRR